MYALIDGCATGRNAELATSTGGTIIPEASTLHLQCRALLQRSLVQNPRVRQHLSQMNEQEVDWRKTSDTDNGIKGGTT